MIPEATIATKTGGAAGLDGRLDRISTRLQPPFGA
jgi:hypothetical protein